MRSIATVQIGQRVLRLIDERFGCAAAFERAMDLPPKTVSNWRRGRSSSYLLLLPDLAEFFHVPLSTLLEAESAAPALGEEEAQLMKLWQKSATLPAATRRALLTSFEQQIEFCHAAYAAAESKE